MWYPWYILNLHAKPVQPPLRGARPQQLQRDAGAAQVTSGQGQGRVGRGSPDGGVVVGQQLPTVSGR